MADSGRAEVLVCVADLQQYPEAVLARLEDMILSPQERQRSRSILRPATRRAYVAAHGLKRLVLWQWVDGPLRFDRAASGKPFLAGTDVHFNLSHADGAVALVVSRVGPVGVDIESTDPRVDIPCVMAVALTPEEQVSVRAAAEPYGAFLRCWTAKEAYVKATGEGLRRGFDTLALHNGGAVAGNDVVAHCLHQVVLARHVLTACVLTARPVAFRMVSADDVAHVPSDHGGPWYARLPGASTTAPAP